MKFLVFHAYREKHVGTIFNEPRKNGAITASGDLLC